MDYASLFQFHKDNGMKATIALYEVKNPSRFGVVELNDENKILRFVEKPELEEAPSNLINAGTYVLDPSILDMIAPETKTSMERDIFPNLVNNGQLFGQKFEGLWIDIGTPSDYMLANFEMLNLISKNKPIVGENVKISEKSQIIPPVTIGTGVNIEEEACIGPNVALGEYSIISKGAKIVNSIVFQRAWVDAFTSIKNAIIGESAVLGRWVKIEDGCIVGDRVVINDNVTLANVKVCPSKELNESIIHPSNNHIVF